MSNLVEFENYHAKYKLAGPAFVAPKQVILPTPLPAIPSTAEFRAFIETHVPDHATIKTESGAQPTNNVLGRLDRVMRDRHNFFAQGAIIGQIVEETHEKLLVIYDRLKTNPSNTKKHVKGLLEDAKACLIGIINSIDRGYNDLEAVDVKKLSVVVDMLS